MGEKVILLDCRFPGDRQCRLLLGPWVPASSTPTQWVLHLQAQGVRHFTCIEVCVEELVGDALSRVIHGPVTTAADSTLTALLSELAGGRVRARASIRSSGGRRILQDGAPESLRLSACLWGR